MLRCRRPSSVALALALGLGACDSADEAAASAADASPTADAAPARRPDLTGKLPYPKLSDYGLFAGRLAELIPARGVVEYDVVAPLWSDGAEKRRFLYVPEGTRATPDEHGVFALPVGGVAVKHFAASGRHIETRLLIQSEDKLTAHTYVWNEAQDEAERRVAGVRTTLTDGSGVERPYLIPNTNQCGNCHELDDVMGLLGVTTAQLARTVTRDAEEIEQRDWLTHVGVLSEPGPDPVDALLVDPYGDAPLEARARSWLHTNCAHCHREGGNGGPSGLRLGIDEQNPTRLGVCKGPVAAGGGSGDLVVDIDPGHPERSIMIFRMKSDDPEIKMPEIPNLSPDPRGVELVSAWVASMPATGCQ